MNEIMLLIIVLFPFATGVLIPLLPFKNRRWMMIYIETVVVINSILVWLLLFNRPDGAFTLLKFTGNLSVTFHLDGLACIYPH